MKKIHLQGDLTLSVCSPIEGEKIVHNGSFIVLEGETGHKHRVSVADPSQMIVVKDVSGNLYLHLLGEGTLTHEEHGTHTLSPGWYKVGQEREYDYFLLENRIVQD